MEEEYKEITIKGNVFRIRFNRSFRAQCELQRLKREILPDDVVKADCMMKDLERDGKGKVQGYKWVPITDEFLEEMDADDGLKLYEETIDFRFKKKTNQQTTEAKPLKSSSKKDGGGKEGSSPKK